MARKKKREQSLESFLLVRHANHCVEPILYDVMCDCVPRLFDAEQNNREGWASFPSVGKH